ncbi:MAG: phage major capsid protein [Clostridia bacterium]|nr:phage major capsid protein [Clostridia bacterium]
MVTIQTADGVLKSFYLDAMTEALDLKANPLLAKIGRSTADVYGKDVRKAVRFGVNGGVGAGSETGELPQASDGEYVQFTSTLKNLYGTIEISDKALRAAQHNEGAFVNLLNEQMDSLVKSAKFNFGRMLFGDGKGSLAIVTEIPENGKIFVDNTKSFVEGMMVTFRKDGFELSAIGCRTVLSVNRDENYITVSGAEVTGNELAVGANVCVQTSENYEITGLGAIFADGGELYGVDKAKYGMMKPYKKTDVGEISENVMQTAIDKIEENSGSKVNFIVCSWGVKRALAEAYRKRNAVLPSMELAGGFNAVSFNGIPVVADRFCPDGTMYLLNTDDFKIHQLCDWQWLEGEDGKILKQVAGKPVYTATLVKYAELMCERPFGQGVLSGITEA